jgi:hypothetical protein
VPTTEASLNTASYNCVLENTLRLLVSENHPLYTYSLASLVFFVSEDRPYIWQSRDNFYFTSKADRSEGLVGGY